MKKLTLIYYIVFILYGLTGCKVPRQLEQTPMAPLPDHYRPAVQHTRQDTIKASTLKWEDFYGDSLLIMYIKQGLAHNLDVRISREWLEQSRAQVVASKGAYLPAVQGGGSASLKRYGLYTMDGAGNATTDILPEQVVPVNLPDYLVGFQASWEVDIAGKLRNRKRAALARLLSSAETRNWVITTLVAELATTYYNLIALDQERDIVENTITLQRRALETIRIQKEAGVTNELAVKQFEAQLLQTESLAYDIRQRLVETENYFNFLLGRFSAPVPRNKAIFDQDVMTKFGVGLPADLLENRPDVRRVEKELSALHADVKAARAAFLPSLSLGGGVGFQAFKTNLVFRSPESFVFSLVGGLWAPVLNRSAIRAEYIDATARQRAALLEYQKTMLQAYFEVNNELTRIENLAGVAAKRKDQVQLLTEAVTISNDLFSTGRADYLEVLVAQQNMLNAELELVNAKRLQWVTMVNLYKTLGGGWR